MKSLSAHDLLIAWEHGWNRHPVDRAQLLRTLSAPSADPVAIAGEPLGARNAALLEVRAATFGGRLRARIDCPQCSAPLELELDTTTLLDACQKPRELVEVQGLRFRPPCNRDLACIAGELDAETATRQLLTLCAIDKPEDLDLDALLSEVESALESADPWSDLSLAVHCDACERRWSEPLDVPALLWDEVQHRARALLDEVHLLAQAYGWTEGMILDLSDRRRAAYLQRVMA
ncbi:hypothetical protein P3H15_28245 [Rhodococcus sp. T2V]|uniref:hypothetical protein n=1 Tax=Rhodococcus sp. T2V TaxID=3034164 RepID=UPI0023E1CDD6|nr:hypothetical protein [Rhodococcus sp. T2V]MDF3308910.1 hypothetical protein [Rhodococcus sp. T2V]